jgi:hypothetical protein
VGELKWVHLLGRERNSCPCPVLSAARPGVVCPLRPPRIYFYWGRLRSRAAACIAHCQFIYASRGWIQTIIEPGPRQTRLVGDYVLGVRPSRGFGASLPLCAGRVVAGIRLPLEIRLHNFINGTCAIGPV